MKILALDLATVTGHALGTPDEGVLSHGSYALPKTGEDIGTYLAAFRGWLNEAINNLLPDEIVFESPILRGRSGTNIITLRKLYGLAGMTEVVALDQGLQCSEAQLANVRTHFLGRGFPRDSKLRKKATVAKCIDRGWKAQDDNAADALALLDYVIALKCPERALDATALFNGGRNAAYRRYRGSNFRKGAAA